MSRFDVRGTWASEDGSSGVTLQLLKDESFILGIGRRFYRGDFSPFDDEVILETDSTFLYYPKSMSQMRDRRPVKRTFVARIDCGDGLAGLLGEGKPRLVLTARGREHVLARAPRP